MAPVSEEQRSAARIETTISCGVATATTSFDAQVANLSLSGAALLGPAAAAERGESVTLMFEHQDGVVSFAVTAEVVRVVDQGEFTLYGVHFENIPPEVRGELVMLLRLIAAGRGADKRAAPRVARRVVVTCGTHESFRAVLNDLSRGGFSVNCTKELQVGEQLHARFGVSGLPDLIEVQGPVVNITPLGDGRFRLGAKFDPLPQASIARIESLIEVLLGLGPRNAVIVTDDEDDGV
jgi:c-di-GMP-binding flagellar brake protein YcgR